MFDLLSRISYADFRTEASTAQAALIALGKAVDDAGVEKSISELVKLRASQVNGCAFCLRLHLDVARRIGVTEEKLDLVAAWREADAFSEAERAALAWTEALTTLAGEAELASAWNGLLKHFTPRQAMFLTVAVGTINQWNRIALGLRFAPQRVVARA